MLGVEVVDLLGGRLALVLRPEPFGVAGEALVQPDVLPGRKGQIVAGPLMGELMHHDRDVVTPRLVEPALGVDRSGLVLQGEPEPGIVVDDSAGLAEGILPEQPGQEGNDLGLPVQGRPGIVAGRRRERLGRDLPVQRVARAVRRRTGDGPAVERIGVGLEGRRSDPVRADHVVQVDPGEGDEPASVATLSAISTDCPAYADRSTVQVSYPSLGPVAACQSPVLPLGVQPSSAPRSGSG